MISFYLTFIFSFPSIYFISLLFLSNSVTYSLTLSFCLFLSLSFSFFLFLSVSLPPFLSFFSFLSFLLSLSPFFFQFNLSTLLLGFLGHTLNGTEVAIFNFNSVYLGPEVSVILTGQRAIVITSSTTIVINTTLSVSTYARNMFLSVDIILS